VKLTSSETRTSREPRRNRPAFDELMQRVSAGTYDVVVIWKLDRFSRSMATAAASLELMDDKGVALVSVNDATIDTTSPNGRLVFQLLTSVAEMERSLTVVLDKVVPPRGCPLGPLARRPATVRVGSHV
jgi:site-specific DNA recombinase